MKAFLVILTLLISPLFAESPIEVLGAFKKAAQDNDFEETWKHTAQFEGIPGEATEYLKKRVQRIIDLLSGEYDFEIIEEKIENNCAVIVINESLKGGEKAFDLDPVYLIKQDGEWKVMPDFTDWRIAEEVAKDKVESYKKLKMWFNKRKGELKQTLRPN